MFLIWLMIRLKSIFLNELKKAVEAKKEMTTHMHTMATLALNAIS